MPEYLDIKDRTCDQYLYGLTLAGVRMLTTDERSYFARHAKNRLGIFAFWFLAGPGLIILSTAWLIYLWKTGAGMPKFDTPSALVFISFVFSPLTFGFAYHTRTKWKAAKSAADDGRVRVFTGMARQVLVDSLKERRALPRNISVEPGRDVTAELYMGHDVLVKFGKERVRRWRKLFVTKAAGVPEKLEYGRMMAEDGFVYKTRRLTPGEIRELRRYYRMGYRPWALITFLLVYGLAAKIVSEFIALESWMHAAILTVGIIASLIIDSLRVLSFIKDARGGGVMAFTKIQMQAETPEFETSNPGMLGEELVEVLPNTGIIWREGREPGMWRDGCR